MSCSFNPPSNGRFRPPLSKKAFPATGWRKDRPVGRSFFFAFPNLFVPFFDVGGGGVPVFRKYSHLF